MKPQKANKSIQVITIILTIVLFTTNSYAQSNTPSKKAKLFIEQAMEENKLPSLSIAVSYKGDVVFAEALGFSNIENKVKASAKSVYRVGSISKSITATQIMLLKQQGKIDINTFIMDYCGAFPDKGVLITSKQLLSHLGGIRHYNFNSPDLKKEYYSLTRYSSSAHSLDIFKTDSLVSNPGTKHHYSSYGYSILGCIIENIEKTSFQKAIKKNIFNLVKMNQSTVDIPEQIIPYRVSAYERLRDGTWANTPPVDLSNKYPGGGILSTPTDLVKFGNSLLQFQILNKESTEEMWTPLSTSNGSSTNYALGWRVSDDKKEIYHGGSSAGGTSYLYIRPEEQLVIAFCSNSSWSNSRHEFVQKLATLFKD